ncbi:LNR domain-containing protein [Plasmodiophora brassicae]
MGSSVIVALAVLYRATTADAESWPGQVVDMRVKYHDDHTWSVVPYLWNKDSGRVARAYVLSLALRSPYPQSIQVVDETNADIVTGRSSVGVWSITPSAKFGLAANATYAGTSFKVNFNGPLWGSLSCFDANMLATKLFFFDSASTESVCGDGVCQDGESCVSCSYDCAVADSSGCLGVLGDGVCNPASESYDNGASVDCDKFDAGSCKKPFTSIFGWGLTTTLIAAGLVASVLFAVLAGLCFRYQSERKKLMEEGDDGHATKQVMKRVTDVSAYEAEIEEEGDGDRSTVYLRDGSEFSDLRPAHNVYSEYDLEAAPQRIPIETRPGVFKERPWAATDSSASAESPQHAKQVDTLASVAKNIVNEIKWGVDEGEAVDAPSRVPGYLQNPLQQGSAQETLRRRSSRQDSIGSAPAVPIDN